MAAGLPAKFAYVANTASNNVSAYSIGANGALKPVPGSPFAAGTEPPSVAVDPTATFAYVSNKVNGNVSGYRIDSNVALKPVPGWPFPLATKPTSLTGDPSGTIAYR